MQKLPNNFDPVEDFISKERGRGGGDAKGGAHGILKFREGRRRDKIYCRFPLGSPNFCLGVTRCVAAAHQKKISRVSDMTLSKATCDFISISHFEGEIQSHRKYQLELKHSCKAHFRFGKADVAAEVRSPAAVTATLK